MALSKRILVLGPPKSGKFTLLKELTGTVPSTSPSAESSHAGLSHSLHIKNKYREHEIPIWIDEYGNQSSSANATEPSNHDHDDGIVQWAESFSSADAGEVVDALGAVVITFRKPSRRHANDDSDGNSDKDDQGKPSRQIRDRIERVANHVQQVLTARYRARVTNNDNQQNENEFEDVIDWDGVCLAVAIPHHDDDHANVDKVLAPAEHDDDELDFDEWDAALQPFGFEFIDLQASGRNQYGELQGLDRIREALGTFAWNDDDDDDDDELAVRKQALINGYNEYDSDLDSDGFDAELREMQMEMAALHFAVDDNNNDNDNDNDRGSGSGSGEKKVNESDIDDMERIMQRMAQVKEQGAGLSLQDRKKLADQIATDLLRLV
ncbi:hypothetical protein V1514DRAFT_334881, partial [Lipomyces japonicus]|uniref:uncharacterized protein n=1 Tax=Lipomyces japonicus TaxID=56871 RepID=UPI0034CEF372